MSANLAPNPGFSFTDEELFSRLTNFEDHFVERKSSGDSKDWLKSAVGFANTVPVGYPAILFIGVKNDGTIEGKANLDSLQRPFSKIVDEAYPPIYYTSKSISRDGKECLAVIILGSALRPHFSGPAYVRIGSETRKASETEYEQLVAQRNSKAYEILQYQGKEITVSLPSYETMINGTSRRIGGDRVRAIVKNCNQFFVELQLFRNEPNAQAHSHPLAHLEISFDSSEKRPQLIFSQF